MLAIRKASARFKSQPLSSVTFRSCYTKIEPSSSCYTGGNSGFGESLPHISYNFRLLKTFSDRAYGTQIPCIGKHSFSSLCGVENGDLKDDIKNVEHEGHICETNLSESESDSSECENELGVSDIKVEVNVEASSSVLFNVIVDSPFSVDKALDKWVEEGHDLSKTEISDAMFELRRQRMFGKALQLSEWLESQGKFKFREREYASRVDLICKIHGIDKAESYVENIPESFRGGIVYRTLLANCVLKTYTKKAEQIFNKMKDLNLPITSFICNQLLLLYKRTDKKKIADVLLLMEKEYIKPSLFTYRVLIERKGESHDLIGMEQILETMKSEGLQPDLKLQAVLAKQYVYAGMKEKAKAVLKDIEGSDLNENRKACSYLLTIYALLESVDDVIRVWEVCKSNPRSHECMQAIDAFGKLKKVEEAEAVFDQLSKKWKKAFTKNYTSMLRVYVKNKMLSKGKDIVRQMSESGCHSGPWTWNALVEFYLESGEIDKVELILNEASQQIQVKPMLTTYMMILDYYAKQGDIHNAEKIFDKIRKDGYVSRLGQYSSLLQAYINAKVPAPCFRERLKKDNVFPSKLLEVQLTQVDAFPALC